jgi:hypothetical protein
MYAAILERGGGTVQNRNRRSRNAACQMAGGVTFALAGLILKVGSPSRPSGACKAHCRLLIYGEEQLASGAVNSSLKR